jgi:hypothetical protein
MRNFIIGGLVAATALTLGAQSADAGRSYRAQRASDCKPYNGPFGFYGNIWCDPSEASYMRNLGSAWPQKTPASLRNPKRDSNYEW